jgi:DNA polymerase-3 subunit delta
MAQKKSSEVDRWLARPDAAVRLVLVYGPDRGLVSERARTFAKSTGLPLDDPFSVVKLDASTLAGDPGRLVDEARTVAMFAPRRLIWVLDAGNDKGLAEAARLLAAEPPTDAVVLVEAGDLKKGSALRSAAEDGAGAMALPCYADDSAAVERLIDEVLGAAGLGITLEARELLRSVLGGDRLASRAELDKLALYGAGTHMIGVDDVRASVGDVASTDAEEAVDAAIDGRVEAFDIAFSRSSAAGVNSFQLLGAVQRQFQSLQLLRETMDRDGKSAASAVASARPPVFFARRGLVERALAAFDAAACARMLDRIQAAILETRRRPDLARAVTRQTLLAVALERARRRR